MPSLLARLAAFLALLILLGASPSRAAPVAATVTDQAWTAICTAPCRVRLTGPTPALVLADTTAPASLAAPPSAALRTDTDEVAFGLTGQTVYARAASGSTSLVTLPASATDYDDAFGAADTLTGGAAPVAPGRSIVASCATAGTLNLTLAVRGTIPWAVGIGYQREAYKVTGYTAANGASCTVLNVNVQ